MTDRKLQQQAEGAGTNTELLRPYREKPTFSVTKNGNGYTLGTSQGDDRAGLREIMVSLGLEDWHLFNALAGQMANATAQGEAVNIDELNAKLAIVRGIEPKDPTEALLAVQMAAIHNATMAAARRLNRADCIEQCESAEKALNRLTRTFTLQVEALKRYRNGGQQTVTVQHVNVNPGGQAIVGNVRQGGGGE